MFKKKTDFYVQNHTDLKKITIHQLQELIERQNKLLKSRSFLERLPDKGEKIILFHNKLLDEQKLREIQINSTCQILSNLTLCDSGPDELEWNEENRKNIIENNDENDCSDIEKLCFKFISNHSGTAFGLKSKYDTKEKNYITRFCKKYDLNIKSKDRFKLNQLKDCSQDLFLDSSVKVKEKLGDKWEITEATPPIFSLKNAKFITLCESLKLQKKHVEKLKKLENNIINAQLRQNVSIKITNSLPDYSVENQFNSKNDYNEYSDDNLLDFDKEENN